MLTRTLLATVMAGAAIGACGESAEPPPPEPAASALTLVPTVPAPTRPPPHLFRVVPTLLVDAIEPVEPFWLRLGFTQISPTHVEDRLVFEGFGLDELEIHYQTPESLARQAGPAVDLLGRGTALVYLTVDDLDAVIERLGGAEIVIPRRETAWGADEIYVRDPAGNVIAFAAY